MSELRSRRSDRVVLCVWAGILLGAAVCEGPVAEIGLKWAINTSAVFSGMTFGAGHQGCQTVWDVDGDGTNEIVFGTRRGASRRLWCFDADGGFEWIYPPMDQDGLPGDPMSKVSPVDLNRDGGQLPRHPRRAGSAPAVSVGCSGAR